MTLLPKPVRGAERKAKKEAFEDDLEWAYVLVDKRDDLRCYVTGTKLVRSTSDPWRVLTHHHLVPRSLAKHRRTEPTNIILLSLAVHRLVTAGALYLLDAHGEKATSTDTLDHAEWNRSMVRPGHEPFRIPHLSRTRAVR